MALYEFHCLSCDRITEKLLPMSDTTQNIMCGWCVEHTAKRIISRNNFHLKGSGWYATSNRSANYTASSSTEEGE